MRTQAIRRAVAESALTRPLALVSVAILLLVGLPVVRFLTDTQGIMLFSVVPIALLAMLFGVRGGLAAALFSSGAYLAWALTGGGFGATADAGTPVCFFLLGLVSGFFAHGALGDFDLRAVARRTALRGAIRRGDVVFHYQPLADARTGAVIAFEALARWQHPERGLLPPAEFIPFAEGDPRTMWELTMRALDCALSEAAEMWKGGEEAAVLINISASCLHREDLAVGLTEAMSRHRCPRGRLGVEITEDALAGDLDEAAGRLGVLRELGVPVVLDDFGTGYSSLTRLARLPLDWVKLDLSRFPGRAAPDGERVIGGIVELAHGLDLTVVAEHVENDERQQLVRRSGCDLIQGFRLSRPLPMGRFRRWLEASHAPSGGRAGQGTPG